MKYLSICSGIEAATVAWHPLGWRSLAFAEIEKFPSAVLKYHYPDVPNLGDITNWKGWPDAAIDVLVGGTPCQSFSVAGLRQGLADPRGNLALIYLAIADRYRPKWLVWENVPGVLSSNGGTDFSAFIGGMAELGYHASWRVLDAQYVRVDGFAGAVPQRRRRVFVVGYLGDWRRAAAVLFEPESLLWDSSPRRQAGKGLAPAIGNSLGGSSQSGGFRTTDLDNQGAYVPEIVTQAMSSKWSKQSSGPAGDEVAHLVAATITRKHGEQSGQDLANGLLVSAAPMVSDPISANEARTYTHEGSNFRLHNCVADNWAVRRLTPRECERLQGFPDDYTAIPKAADGPRYKALGNAMAVNVMRWLGQRIQIVERT